MQKKILLMLSVLLVMITSVAYSALSTSLSITSEVKFRVLADIRVNSVALENSNGGLLAYESEYSKNTVSNGFTLPTSGSSISYRVHIDNAGDVDYSIYDILKTTNNNGLNVAVSGYNIRDVIPAKTSVDLILTYTTSSPSENIINVVNTFDFKRVFYVTYETGTQEVIPQQIKYQGVNLALTNTQPTKNGYTFSKWNTKSDGSGVNYNSGASYTVDDDVTLYARYNLATYNINYVLNGGTNNANNPSTYTIESNNITLADATKTGYTFKGWTGNGTTTPTKNLVLPKGSYGDKTFTANFKDETDPEITVTSQDGTVNYLENAQTIDAAFGSSNGTIAYKINATDEGSGIDTIEYAITNSSTVPTTGWTTTTNGNHSDSKARGTYYLHVKATDQDGNEKVVTTKLITIRFRVAYYDYFNASTTVSENQYYTGTALTSRTPSAHSGYSFDGWYNSTALTTKTVNANTSYTPTTSIQLYGKWTPVDYAITYALNNGTNNSNNPDSYNIESENITLAAPSKALTFKGNYNATSGANAANGTVTIGSNTTKAQTFAGWTGSNGTTAQTTVTIPTGSTGDKSYTAHWTAVAGTVPTVTRTGYTCGWSTSSTGTTIEITSGGTFPTSSITEEMSSTVNLYAVCNINSYNVIFKDKNGNNLKTESVNYGYSATAPNLGTGLLVSPTFQDNSDDWYLDSYANISNGRLTTSKRDIVAVNAMTTSIPSTKKYYAQSYVDNTNSTVLSALGIVAYDSSTSSNTYPAKKYAQPGERTEVFTYMTVGNQVSSVTPWIIVYQSGSEHTSTAVYSYAQVWPVTSENVTNLTDKAGYTFTGWDKQFASITEPTVVNPTYSLNTYNISYSLNNGTVATANPTSYNVESSAITLNNPTKTLTFKGNYNATSGANASNGTVTIGSNTTKAQTFAGWSGTGLSSNTVNVTIPTGSYGDRSYTAHWTAVAGTVPTVTREGYTCGWSTSSTGTTIEVTSGGTFPTTSISEGMSSTVNLYAVCNPNTYTVTANANGGSISSTTGWTGTGNTSTKQVTYDSTYGTLPTATRTGYTFAGWTNQNRIMGEILGYGKVLRVSNTAHGYTDPNYVFNENEKIVFDVTLPNNTINNVDVNDVYADVNSYTISGNRVYGTIAVTQAMRNKFYPTYRYKFVDINAEQDIENYTINKFMVLTETDTKMQIASVHDLYALWSINNPATPTITGGATKIYGSSATTLTCSTATNYTGATKYYSFGYATSDGGTPSNWTTPTTTNTLSVGAQEYVGQRWYSCRVYATDGTQTTSTVASATTADTEMTINNATLTFDKGNCTSTSGTTTLYTKKDSTKVYTGIRNTTEGTIPTASKTGYTFQGWYDANSNGNKVLNANGSFTGTAVTNYTNANSWNATANQTLYARCTPNSYTVTANANGGNIPSTSGWSGTGATSTKQVTYDSTYGTLPTPTKAGYDFAGWNGKNLFNKDATPYKMGYSLNGDDESEAQAGEYSIYQISIKPNTTYTITNSGQSYRPGYVVYNSNGVSIAHENYNGQNYVTFTTLSTASYIRFSVVTNSSSGRYDKDIFQIEEGSVATTYEPYYITSSTKVTIPSNHEINAHWTPATYTVTAKANGGSIPSTSGWTGTGNSATKSVTYDSTYGTLPTPTRAGYTFAGWNGKNLFTGLIKGVSLNPSTGVESAYSYNATSDYIEVDYVNNSAYYLSGLSDNLFSFVTIYDQNKEFLGRTSGSARTEIVLNSSNMQAYRAFDVTKAKYVRIIQSENDNTSGHISDVDNLNIQLEKGSTATAYEPYYITSSTKVTTAGNHDINAIWVREGYTITYSMNNGTNGNNPTTYNVESPAITLAAPSKTLTFVGHYNATSGANASSTTNVQIGSNTTKAQTFAGWTGSNGSTAQTNVTIPTGSTGDKSYTAHWTAVAGTVPTVTRTGYTCGWSTSSSGTTIEIASGGSYATSRIAEGMSATVNLYAVCVDDIAPTIVSATPSTVLDLRNYIEFNATDAGTGVSGYNITTTNTAPTAWIPVVNAVETTTETKYEYNAAWARVFHHNNHWGSVYFSKENSSAEAKSSNTNDKYSVLGNIANYKNSSNWEFLLQYPDVSSTQYNRWTQTKNPITTSSVDGGNNEAGYSKIHADWEQSEWKGITLSANPGATYMDGSPDHWSWWYALGTYAPYDGGMPGPNAIASSVNLWSRIDNLSTTTSANLTRKVGDIAADGAYYLWVKDAAGNTNSQQVTINKVDTTKPTATITSTNNVATSQTVTLTLGDNKALDKYYWSTAAVSTNPTFTTIANNSIASTQTTTINSDGTYYLSVVDKAGNRYYVAKNFYKTTLNANGGSVSPAYVITMDGNSYTLPNPTRIGYDFAGWYTDSGLTTAVTLTNGKYKPTATGTLYAKWTPASYTVTAKANGGSISSTSGWSGTGNTATKSVTYLSTYGTLPTVARNGYTFNGWNGKNLFNPDTMEMSNTTHTSGSEEITLNAGVWDRILHMSKWVPTPNTTYTLVAEIITNTFDKDMQLSTDERFYISGYNGDRTIPSGFTGKFITTFTTRSDYSDVTIGSLWFNTSNTVTGTLKMKLAIYEGTNKTEYEPYYITSSTQMTTPFNHDINARWTRNDYSITYALNNGTVASSNPTSYHVESSAITLNNPTKTLIFKGNYNATNGANAASGTVTIGNNTTQAQTFAGWSGTGLSGNSTTVTIPTGSTGDRSYAAHWTAVAGTLPTVERTGYTCGWSTSSTGTTIQYASGGTYPTIAISESMGVTVNLYAVCNQKAYTLTLNTQGGTYLSSTTGGKNLVNINNYTNTSSETIRVNENSKLINPNFKSLTRYTASATVSLDNNTNSFGIYVGYTDGTYDYLWLYSRGVAYPSVTTANNKTVDYIEFAYDSGSNVTMSNFQLEEGTAATSYQAYVSQNTTTTTTRKVLYDFSYNNDIGVPTKAGYTFNGWYTAASGGVQVYDSNGRNVNASDYWTAAYSSGKWKYANNLTLYAQWTPNTYTVVYNNSCDNTKSGSMANSTYTYDTNGTLRTNAFTCNAVVTYNYNGATGGNSNATSTATSEFLGWTVGAPNLLRYRDLNNNNLMTINTDGTLSFDYQNTDNSGTRYANFFYNKNNNLETNTNYVFVADIKSLSSINVEDYNGMNIAQPNTGTQLSSDYQSVHYTGVGLNYHNTKTISDFSSANNYALRGFMWIRAGTSRSMTFRPMLFKGTYNGIDLYYYDEGTVRNLATSGTVNLYADWTYETPITLPTPTKTGYTFNGWYSDSSFNTRVGGGGDSYTPSVNRTLYAKWTPNTYQLTINPQGGTYNSTTNNSTKTMTYDSTNNNDIGVPTRDGYTFNGWYTEANGGTQIYGTNGRNVNASGYWDAAYSTGKWKKTSAVTVYAHWSKAVTATTNSVNPTSYIYDGTAKSPTPTIKDGSTTLTAGTDYTVSGNSNTNVGQYTVTISGSNVYNATTKAYYTGSTTLTYYINNATLTFDKGSCTSTSGTTTLYTRKNATAVYTGIRETTTTGTIPTASKSGYTFNGWYTASSGGSKVLNANGTFTGTAVTNYTNTNSWNVTANQTLYAQCGKDSYSITYSMNNGTNNSNNPSTYTVDSSAITLAAPSKTLTFKGNANATSGANAASGTVSIGSNTTTAQTFAGWSGTGITGNSTTVTIPTGSTGNRSYTAHWTAVAGTVPTVTRTGYTCGWSTSSTGTTIEIASGGSYATSRINEGMSSTVNLYAVCTPASYTLTANANGGTISSTTGWSGTGNTSTKSVTYLSTYGTLPDASRTGHTFAGWSLLPEGYRQVEYIKSDGNSYIDTDLALGDNFDLSVGFIHNQLSEGEQAVVSTWTSTYNYWNLFINSSNAASLYLSGHNVKSINNIGVENIAHVIRNGNTWVYSINDNTSNITYSGSTNPTTLKILKRGDLNNSDAFGKSYAGITSLIVYNNGTLVLNMVPCVNESTGKAGLYDLVEAKFYGNDGTGDFIAGPTKYITSSTIVNETVDHTIYAHWTPNTYTVTCEDWFVDASNNRKVKLGTGTTKTYTYNTTASGADWGATTSISAYYGSYAYVSSTNATVPANNNLVVYRYFHAWTNINVNNPAGIEKGDGSVARFSVSYNSGSTYDTNQSNEKAVAVAYGTKIIIKDITMSQPYYELNNVTATTYDSTNNYYVYEVKSSSSININTKYKTFAITLDRQSGSGGTSTIYEKYNTGYYTDSAATTQMSTSANGITVPTRTGYTFGGYYTATNGGGTQYIDANGKLTSNASVTNFSAAGSLYAKWTVNSYNVTFDNNYLKDDVYTNTSRVSSYYSAGTTPTSKVEVEDETAANGYYIEFTMPTSTTDGGPYYAAGSQLPANKTYTWSVEVKASKAMTLRVGHEQGGVKGVNVTTSWQRVTHTFTTTDSQYKAFVLYAPGGNTWTAGDKIYIRNLYLEEGTGSQNFSTSSKQYNSQLGTLPIVTRTGYTFDGWFTDPVGGTEISSTTTVPANNVAYYAHWTPNKYYLDLNGWLDGASNGGISPYGTADVYINGVQVRNDTTDYYTQSYTGSTYEVKDIKANPGYTYNGVYSGTLTGTIVDGQKTVILNFSTNSYTLTYGLNNGTLATANPSTYNVRSEDITLNNPTKTLTFKGNYNSTSGTNAASGQVTIGSNTTQAQTFAGWSGTGLSSNTVNVTIPTGSTGNRSYTAHWTAVAGTLPTVTRTGYTCGWNTSSTGTTIQYASGGTYPTTAISEGMSTTVNLYAVCNPNTYGLTIDPNGGTYNSTTGTSTKNMTYDATTNNDIGVPTRDGYTFQGWYTDASNGLVQIYDSNGRNVNASGYWSAAYSSGVWKKTSAVRVYARWYKAVSTTTNSVNPTSYIYDGTAKSPTETVKDGSTTLTNGTDYTVAFSNNTNVGTATATITGKNVYNATTKAYYTGTATVNYYINNATLTFDKGSCASTSGTTTLYTYKGATKVYTGIRETTTTGTIPTASKSGYTFQGWYTASSGGSKVLNANGTFSGTAVTNYTNANSWQTVANQTLYAQCSKDSYSITYSMNNGTNNSNNPSTYTVESATITLAAPSKTLTFVGNYNSTSGTNAASGQVTIGSNTTQAQTFAGWTGSNGSTAQTSVTIAAGSTGNKSYTAHWTAVAGTVPTVTRTGYTCGWSTSSTGTTIEIASGGSYATSRITEGMAATVNLYAVCVDNIAPTIVSTTPTTTLDLRNYVDFNATDAGTGVSGYNITSTNTAPTTWIPVVNAVTANTETKYFGSAAWARVFHQNNHWGEQYFANKTEAKSSSTIDKYSVLDNIANYKANNKWELLLEYPELSASQYNRWTQTANPVTDGQDNGSTVTPVAGYTSIHTDWGSFGGLEASTSSSTLMDGNTGHGNWCYAIGVISRYLGGMPGNCSPTSTANLWARIDNLSTTTSANLTRRIGDIAADGTYYVWVKDAAGNTNSTSITINKVDTTKPTATITSTNNVATSQTATLTLGDNKAISKYYFGSINLPNEHNPTYTTVSNTPTSSTQTSTVSSEGTYYLSVVDVAGNRYYVSKNFYKTTFNANSGSVSPANVITMSGNSFTLPNPTRTGYNFAGWYTDSGLTTAVTLTSGKYAPNASATLYAKWTPASYTLTANANGGSIPSTSGWSGTGNTSTKSVTYLSTYGTLPTPTRSGYTFSGWTSNNIFENGDTLSGISISGTKDETVKYNGSTSVKTDRAWKGIYLNLKKLYDEGKISIGDKLTFSIYYKTDFTLTKNTTFTLYRAYDSYARINVTVADAVPNQWHRLVYTITVDATSIASTDARIEADYYEQSDYTFAGNIWFAAPQIEIGESATGYTPYYVTSGLTVEKTSNHTIKANWTRNNYSITYTLNNGTVSTANPTTYHVESSAITLNNPTKTLTFKGNYNATSGANAANGQVTIGSNTTKAQTFAGWTGSNGTTAQTNVTIPSGSTGDKSYTAHWTAVAGATPTVTRTGYTCGWNRSSTGTTIEIASGGNFPTSYISEGMSATVNLYAVCTPKTYTLTINPNGGLYSNSASTSTKTMTYDSTNNNDIGTPTRNGYTFDGWYTAASNGTQVYGTNGRNVNASSYWTAAYSSGKWKYDGNLTVYAHWTEKTYTLTINPNGGSLDGSTSTVTRNLKYSDVSNITTPTRTGYTFNEWSELSNKAFNHTLSYVNLYRWNGSISLSTQSKSADNPLTGMTNEIKIVNTGEESTSPGLAGFVHGKSATANGVYVHVFVAKLPVGKYFHNANNNLGTGATTKWLTSNEGTGNWQTYVYQVNAGTGTVQDFGYVYVSSDPTNTWGGTRAETGSYTAYLAYSNIFDITSNTAGIGQYDGTGTLTASWTPNTYSIGYTMNGGPNPSTKPTSGTYDADVNISNPASKTFTVNINANGQGATIKNASGTVVTSATATQTFAGWTSTTMGSNAKTGTGANPSTAWNGSSTKNTYFKNLRESGTVTMVANWNAANATLPNITKTGYTCGYATSDTGSIVYNSGASYATSTTGSSVTLYAKCTINSYTLTINPNGGTYNSTTSNTTVTQNYGTTYNVANNPTKAGYVFGGWTLSGGGSHTYYDTSVTPTSTQTFNYNAANSTLPGIYNNSGESSITRSMVSDSTATGGYSLKITTNGSASPGAGGISLSAWPTNPDRINVLEVKAKIPTGYNLYLAGISANYTGVGSTVRYSSSEGTGNWKTYYLVVYTGKAGQLTSTAYLYVNGSNNTSVSWNINSIVMKSYTQAQFKTIYTFGSSNGTLTANWNAGGVKVSFNPQGGSWDTTYVKNWTNNYVNVTTTNADRYYNYDSSYGTHPGSTNYDWTPDSRVISKTGNTFAGWYTAETGGTQVFDADGKLKASVSGYSDANSKWTKYDSNVTLYARWSAVNHTVTYNTTENGGTGTVASQTVGYGSSIPLPTTGASKSGWTFVGWNTDKNATSALTSLTMGLDNVTLYAIYRKEAVTLTANWNANGATLSSTSQSSCQLAAVYNNNTQATSCQVTAPTITRANYNIIGFNTTSTATTNNSSYNTSTGKLTLTSSNTGSTWYAITQAQPQLTATFAANNGATVASTSASCYVVGSNTSCQVTAPSVTPQSGFSHIGFNTTTSATSNSSSYNTGTNKLTISANGTWYPITRAQFTGTFTIQDSNAATQSGGTPSCYKYNGPGSCNIVAPTLTAKSGYTVLGWNTNQNATSAAYASGATISISGNTQFYSITKASTAITITFNRNTANSKATSQTPSGGTASTDTTVTASCEKVNGATSCSVTSPTMAVTAGYHAVGYNTSATATSSSWNVNTAKSVSANATYYAITAPNTYSIKFNANCPTGTTASGSMSDLSMTYGTAKNLTTNAFGCTNREFVGWATEANGTVAYNNQASVNNLTTTNGGTFNLYAKWRLVTPPLPTASGGTTRVYGSAGDVILTCNDNINMSSYPSGAVKYYSFGYSTTSNGNLGSWSTDQQSNTYSVSTNYIGTRYYACKVYVSTSTEASDVTIGTTRTSLTVRNAKITFNANGCGTITGTNPAYVKQGMTNIYTGETNTTNGTMPYTSATGKTFTGWYSGSTQVINASKVVNASVSGWTDSQKKWLITEDKTLTAGCSNDPYTITYSMNNGTNNSNNPSTYTVASPDITLAAPTKVLTFHGNANGVNNVSIGNDTTKAQDFAGWTGSNGTTAQTSVKITSGSTGNKSYTAHWTAAAGTVPTVTKSGYTCGWNRSSTGTTIEIASGGTFPTSYISESMNATVNLYAVCNQDSYTITASPNGGSIATLNGWTASGNNATKSIASGGTYGTLPTVTAPTGKVFVGWYTQASGGTQITSSTQLVSNSSHSIYAHYADVWAENIGYSRTFGSVVCSDAQCAIDQLWAMLSQY